VAQKVQVVLVDDIDGSAATETVAFALDGSSYEVDLTAAHAAELRDALAPWIKAGRRVSARKSPARSRRAASDASTIRTWAKANGVEVPERGRIPAKVREAYDAAQ
jgi:hypothetical protein